MWLGIVIHAAANHLAITTTLPWRDSETSIIADLLSLIIHAFRMPLFFIISGLLLALMIKKYGPAETLKRRLRRLALPFIVFWPIIFILTVLLIAAFINVMNTGKIELSIAPLMHPEDHNVKIHTLHLWFLYYLIWLSIIASIMPKVLRMLFKRRSQKIMQALTHKIFEAIAGSIFGVFILALPSASISTGYKNGIIQPDGSLMINIIELLHHGIFFLFGYLLYHSYNSLNSRYSRYYKRYLIIAIVSTIGYLSFIASKSILNLSETLFNFASGYYYNCLAWLWSFAFLGLFSRYLSLPNKLLGYMAESAYWVYLIHMLGTIGFGVLLSQVHLGAIPKMLVNIILTSIFCITTYQLFVRHSFIGIFLNGKNNIPNHTREP